MGDNGQDNATRETSVGAGRDRVSQDKGEENKRAATRKDGAVSQARQDHDAQRGGLLLPSSGWSTLSGYGRPRLRSKASTAVSINDVQLQPSPPGRPSQSRATSTARTVSYAERLGSRRGSDIGDDASIRSFQSFALDRADNVESLIGDLPAPAKPHFGGSEVQAGYGDIFSALASEDAEFRELFRYEFDELEDVNADGSNEGPASRSALVSLLTQLRGIIGEMALQAQALPDPLLCRKAHLQ